MKYLDLQEAWDVLGENISYEINRISKLRRHERIDALRLLTDDARRKARSLLIKHHPDTGGDSEKFKKVQSALDSIIYHTNEFERKMLESMKRAEELNSRRLIIIESGSKDKS